MEFGPMVQVFRSRAICVLFQRVSAFTALLLGYPALIDDQVPNVERQEIFDLKKAFPVTLPTVQYVKLSSGG